MALTVIQYAQALKQRQIAVARRLGMDIPGAQLELRIIINIVNVSIGVLVRTLVLKGVITDADLVAVLDASTSEPYTAEPVSSVIYEPPPPP